jgi:hypothetical protein
MLACVAGVYLFAGASPVVAQYSSMSMGLYNDETSFRPDLSARDLKLIIRVLVLGEAEQQALNDLYAGYAATLQNEGADVRAFVNGEIERAEIMQDMRLLDKAQKRIADWEKRSEQVKKQFLDDLKSLLTREQEGRWPVVERELRRWRKIGSGRLCGESLDLVRMTEDALGTPPGAELAATLNHYSDDLDRSLVARDAFIGENAKVFTESETSDPQKAKAIWDEGQHFRSVVRDINERYARLISSQLPPDNRAAFEKQLFDQTYRPIVKATKTEEYLKEAAALAGLSGEQRARLDGIQTKYEAERRALLERAARGWRDFEATMKPERLAEALGEKPKDENNQMYNGAWLPESHPLVQYRRARFELDQAMRVSIDAVLTSEQRVSVTAKTVPYAEFQNWTPYGL